MVGRGWKIDEGKKREETRVKKGTKRISLLSTQSPLIFSLVPCIWFNSLAPHHLNIWNRLDKKGRRGKRGKGKGGKRKNYREKVGHFRRSLHTILLLRSSYWVNVWEKLEEGGMKGRRGNACSHTPPTLKLHISIKTQVLIGTQG